MEEIYVHIGSSGLYQMLVFFALLPFGLYSGLDIAPQNALYGEPTHWCRVPYLQNLTVKEQMELAIPVNEETGAASWMRLLRRRHHKWDKSDVNIRVPLVVLHRGCFLTHSSN